MNYHPVGNRIVVDLSSFELLISNEEALSILIQKGFKVVGIDIISLARALVGHARYQRGADPDKAPAIVDCSSLMIWLYEQRGINLPRYSIEQRDFGEIVSGEPKAGDLVFMSGKKDYYWNDPNDGTGHVGIATGEGTVIHAANSELGVIESTFEDFIGDETKFRGIRRYLDNERVLTLEMPPSRKARYPRDLRWLILQTQPSPQRQLE